MTLAVFTEEKEEKTLIEKLKRTEMA